MTAFMVVALLVDPFIPSFVILLFTDDRVFEYWLIGVAVADNLKYVVSFSLAERTAST